MLTAAVTLYADRGHAQVSLDDVARAAKVTRGAVSHHYGSRTGLFAAVAEHVQSQVSQAVVAAAVGAGDDPFARLRAGSHAFLDAVTAPGVVQVLLVDAPALIGWQRWRRRDAQHSGRHLCDALADLGVPDDLLDALTAHLSGAMNEAALWLVDHADEPAAPQAGHRALDVILQAAVLAAASTPVSALSG